MIDIVIIMTTPLSSGGSIQAAGWLPSPPADQTGDCRDQPDRGQAQPRQHPTHGQPPGHQAPGSSSPSKLGLMSHSVLVPLSPMSFQNYTESCCQANFPEL